MKVIELIEELKQYPPDMEVVKVVKVDGMCIKYDFYPVHLKVRDTVKLGEHPYFPIDFKEKMETVKTLVIE